MIFRSDCLFCTTDKHSFFLLLLLLLFVLFLFCLKLCSFIFFAGQSVILRKKRMLNIHLIAVIYLLFNFLKQKIVAVIYQQL